MAGYPNDQSNPNAAIPVWLAGGNAANLTTNTYSQVKVGIGVLSGLVVGVAGTSSAVTFYDGTSSVVTITIAAPGVISWAGHPFVPGNAVVFETTGALPTGLTAGTKYYVSTVGLTANAFSVADTAAHALAGTNTVTTTGTQSGVHTAWNVSVPVGPLSTTAQATLPLGVNGWMFSSGLIASTTASGGAAGLIILYR